MPASGVYGHEDSFFRISVICILVALPRLGNSSHKIVIKWQTNVEFIYGHTCTLPQMQVMNREPGKNSKIKKNLSHNEHKNVPKNVFLYNTCAKPVTTPQTRLSLPTVAYTIDSIFTNFHSCPLFFSEMSMKFLSGSKHKKKN